MVALLTNHVIGLRMLRHMFIVYALLKPEYIQLFMLRHYQRFEKIVT